MDIMVNGTSVASGWGNGTESFSGFDSTHSWPHWFANQCHATNLWNHSFPSKPTALTIRDQYNFCKQYISQGRNPQDLLCLIEFLLPDNPVFIEFKTAHEVIFPVLMHNDPAKLSLADINSEWTEFFVSSPTDPDYFSGSIYTPVVLKHIQKDNYFVAKTKYFAKHSLSARLLELQTHIASLQSWLHKHGINYLMFWACGDGDSNRKFIDRTLIPVMPHPERYIPMREFTSMNWGAAQSIDPKRGHPDLTGNKKIAEYLFEQTTRRNAWPRAQLIPV